MPSLHSSGTLSLVMQPAMDLQVPQPLAEPEPEPSASPDPQEESTASPAPAAAPTGRPRLRTNKHALPPYATPHYKLAQSLDAQDVSISPEPSFSRSPMGQQLPRLHAHRSPTSPGSRADSPMFTTGLSASPSQSTMPAAQRSWSPVKRAPMPVTLSFDSWWNERGQRVCVVVSYNTESHICTASLNVNVDARIVPRHGQASVEPWDLHVGAQLRLLGRTLTLRKARDEDTVCWLDQQARVLLQQIARLEGELGKYRVVMSPVPGIVPTTGLRSERLDNKFHGPVPCGGTINLRGLRERVLSLAQALRQHQCTLPPITCLGGTKQLDGPQDWAPERALAAADEERRQVELRAKQAKEAAAAEEAYARRDLFEWLVGIPLAASAAHLERRGNKFVDPIKAAQSTQRAQAKAEAQAQRALNNRRGSALMLDMDAFYKQSGVVPGSMTRNSDGELKSTPSWLRKAPSGTLDPMGHLPPGVHLVQRPSFTTHTPVGAALNSGPNTAHASTADSGPAAGAAGGDATDDGMPLARAGSREFNRQPSILVSQPQQLVLTPRTLARMTGQPFAPSSGSDDGVARRDTGRRDQQEVPAGSEGSAEPLAAQYDGQQDVAMGSGADEERIVRHNSVGGRALLPTLKEEQESSEDGAADAEMEGESSGAEEEEDEET